MHRTPNPQTRTAGPARKRPARKKKDERGMALIFALLGILLLSMLAAALLVVTRALTPLPPSTTKTRSRAAILPWPVCIGRWTGSGLRTARG